MSVLAEFSLFPLGGETSLSPFVARVLKVIKTSGLPYELGCMGTVVEGEWDQLLELLDKCQKVLAEDCDRVIVNFKADCKKGPGGRMRAKVVSVEEKINRA